MKNLRSSASLVKVNPNAFSRRGSAGEVGTHARACCVADSRGAGVRALTVMGVESSNATQQGSPRR